MYGEGADVTPGIPPPTSKSSAEPATEATASAAPAPETPKTRRRDNPRPDRSTTTTAHRQSLTRSGEQAETYLATADTDTLVLRNGDHSALNSNDLRPSASAESHGTSRRDLTDPAEPMPQDVHHLRRRAGRNATPIDLGPVPHLAAGASDLTAVIAILTDLRWPGMWLARAAAARRLVVSRCDLHRRGGPVLRLPRRRGVPPVQVAILTDPEAGAARR